MIDPQVTDPQPGGHRIGVAVPSSQSDAPARPARHLHALPDLPGLDAIYRAHVDFVLRIAGRLGVPAHHREDVVHDVFLVVHRRLPDLRADASVRSWLFGITKRVVFHHVRGAGRAVRRERQASGPTPVLDPEEDVARRQAARMVEASLAALPPDQRLVLVLADLEEMTAPEIADALGVKLNTVYARLRLGRRRFERALAQWQEGRT
jgi:RNA polymerase sigma-70 factor (ECF subfamily)